VDFIAQWHGMALVNVHPATCTLATVLEKIYEDFLKNMQGARDIGMHSPRDNNVARAGERPAYALSGPISKGRKCGDVANCQVPQVLNLTTPSREIPLITSIME